MATRIFGGSDGNWNNTANWTGSTVPVTGDTVILPNGVTSGIVAGLDQTGVDLAKLMVHAGFSGAIGSAGGPLKIAASIIEYRGSGGFYLENAANGVSNFACDDIRIIAANPTTPVQINGADHTTQEFGNIWLFRGNISLGAGMGVPTTVDMCDLLVVGHASGRDSDVTVTVANGAGDLPKGQQFGGTLTTDGQVDLMQIFGGDYTHADGAMTLLEAFGGIVGYDSDGTLTTARIYNEAIFDLTRNMKQKTVSSVFLAPQCVARFDRELHTLGGTSYVDLRKNQ